MSSLRDSMECTLNQTKSGTGKTDEYSQLWPFYKWAIRIVDDHKEEPRVEYFKHELHDWYKPATTVRKLEKHRTT
ncbi:hypothetical protein KIN20_016506 [Parelaphostrongylus tenuis]|uniref:Uncharacterized protein n=1 Tax=Parelaphostrongylus tenuis TaxID=148309 RepID=A0AAD5MLQ0_PARTN|nr:hypothetical protein KIN20_016506 [Parelaphostrongylus tenuis]